MTMAPDPGTSRARQTDSASSPAAVPASAAEASLDPVPVPAQADPPPRKRLARWFGADARATAINLVFLVLGAGAIGLIALELSRETLRIDAIDVPESLARAGYTQQVVARRLVDQILRIRTEALMGRENRALATTWSQPDIVVPGTGLSARAVADYVRGLLGRPDQRVGGEVVEHPGGYVLRLRMAGVGEIVSTEARSIAELDQLLHQGARAIQRKVEPEVLAGYLYMIGDPIVGDVLRKFLATEPPRSAKRRRAEILQGLIALRERNFDLAIQSFERVFDRGRSDWPDLRALIGEAQYLKGDLDGALASLRSALEFDSEMGYASRILGLVLQAKGDLDGALASFRRATEHDPEDAIAHDNLGRALHDKGDIDGALASFRRVVDLLPKGAHGHIGVGRILQSKGDLDGAIDSYRRALELAPQQGDAAIGHALLGSALYDKGDLDGAAESYRRAVELAPQPAIVHNNFGHVLFEKGDLDGAVASLRRAVELDPTDVIAKSGLEFLLNIRKGRSD